MLAVVGDTHAHSHLQLVSEHSAYHTEVGMTSRKNALMNIIQ